ncbi:hypothetical protein LI031_31280, partial [Enterocloster citroniae]|nr:hypothetical protein [Enterocloster citroniae]
DMPIGRMPYDFLRYDYHTARNPVKQAFLILNPPYILAPVLLECYRQKYSIFIGKEIYKKGRFLRPISY